MMTSRTRYFKEESLKNVDETLSGVFLAVFAQLIYCKSDLLLDEHVQICRFAEKHSS